MVKVLRLAILVTLLSLALLAGPGAAATMGSIGKERVNIRARPSLRSPVRCRAELGQPLQLERRQDNWVFVHDWKGNAGWVYRSLISRIRTVIVLAAKANLRQAPGLKNRVVGQASRGEVYKIFGSRGNWVKIGYYLEDEVIGWIHGDLVWGLKPRRWPQH